MTNNNDRVKRHVKFDKQVGKKLFSIVRNRKYDYTYKNN